jgi:hypothetical protein
MRSANAFLIGVGTAYFFDPRLGKGRRAVARDRGAKVGRRVARTASKRARFTLGKLVGVYARGRNLFTRPEVATDDATVEQRIRSEAFRDVDGRTSDLDVEVEGGVATLTGTVAGDEVVSDLVESVGKVVGVKEVSAAVRVASDSPTPTSG